MSMSILVIFNNWLKLTLTCLIDLNRLTGALFYFKNKTLENLNIHCRICNELLTLYCFNYKRHVYLEQDSKLAYRLNWVMIK